MGTLTQTFNNNSSKISKASLEKTEKKQDDIKYVLEIQNSNYVFYEIPPGIDEVSVITNASGQSQRRSIFEKTFT